MEPAPAFLTLPAGGGKTAHAAEMACGKRPRKAGARCCAPCADLVSTTLARYLNGLSSFSGFL
jgi:hypothetical protein